MASFQASWFSSFTTISHTSTKKSQSFKPFRVSFSLLSSNDESSDTEPAPIDPVKLAFAKAKQYKKLKSEQNLVEDSAEEYKESSQLNPELNIEQNPVQDSQSDGISNSGETSELPDSVKIAMEKAKEYRKNKGNVQSDKLSGNETKISVNSGSVEKKTEKPTKKGKLSVSSIDFIGLNFADKKEGRSLPAGLIPISDPFSEKEIPDVEFIVGDTSKFAGQKSTEPDQVQKSTDVYEPKVATWGVFPRPSDISKTFGGGRTLKPGEALETEEERAAKDAKTKELIAAYNKRTGKNIDPKLKSECEEILKDGDALMDVGKLNDALAFYQKVMDKLPFQSELHGLAALQWSICKDSLIRTNEARVMYEKLQSHPVPRVSKKARQFMYSFQAMEMLKVTAKSSATPENTAYRNYFEAFVEKKSNYSLQEVEAEVVSLNQTLPYILLIISPIFLVLIVAIQKRI